MVVAHIKPEEGLRVHLQSEEFRIRQRLTNSLPVELLVETPVRI